MKYGVHRLTRGKRFDQNDLKTFFRQVKEIGAEIVEMRPSDETLRGDREKTAKIRKLTKEIRVQLLLCRGYPKGMDMRSSGPFIRQYAVGHLEQAVEVAYYLGGTKIGGILYSTWPTDYQNNIVTPEVKYERIQYSLKCIRKVIPTTGDYHIQLNMKIANRFENYTINTVQEGLGFIRQVESDHCDLLLNVFHMDLEEDDVLQAVRYAKGHIRQFHVSEPNHQIPCQNKRIS